MKQRVACVMNLDVKPCQVNCGWANLGCLKQNGKCCWRFCKLNDKRNVCQTCFEVKNDQAR